jgi:hypothetical protein
MPGPLVQTEISFNEAGLQFLLRDPRGPVGNDLERRVNRIVEEAKDNATGRPVDTSVVPGIEKQFSLFGGGLAVRGAGGRFERSRASEAFRSAGNAQRGPNVKTGRLHASIRGEVTQQDGELVGSVGTDVPYAFYLETGVRGGRQFPFLTPALAAAGD